MPGFTKTGACVSLIFTVFVIAAPAHDKPEVGVKVKVTGLTTVALQAKPKLVDKAAVPNDAFRIVPEPNVTGVGLESFATHATVVPANEFVLFTSKTIGELGQTSAVGAEAVMIGAGLMVTTISALGPSQSTPFVVTV